MIDALQYQLGVDPAQLILGLDALRVHPLPATSRYHGVAVKIWVDAGGQAHAYLARRLVPSPERLATLRWHLVVERERLDHIAARELGDAEQFWRLCDANRVLRPEELEVTGRLVRVTLPDGIPGTSDD